MKEFINKIFSNQQVSVEELSKFIVEYAELCEIRSTTPQHIQFAIQLIQKGINQVIVIDDFLGATFLSSDNLLSVANDLKVLIPNLYHETVYPHAKTNNNQILPF